MAKSGFGPVLKKLRISAGLKQEDLAYKSGIARETISRFEKGHLRPRWESVQKLAAALGISCEAFQEEAQTLETEPAPVAKKPASQKPAKRPAKKKRGT